jgi:gliding motility-associated-like protein
MKAAIVLVILAFSFTLQAQTISPHVINSAGGYRPVGTGGLTLSDNVGEPFTETFAPGNFMITQGFLQPPVNDGTTILINGVSCATRADGFISIDFSSVNAGHQETYLWSAGACPSDNCGNTVDNLKPGSYFVTIISVYNHGSVQKSDTIRKGPMVVASSSEECKLKIFSGVTPNGDGQNDRWIIDNISEYPNNRVTIYNRWGTQLYDVQGYDNITKYWPSEEMLNKLVSSTYFYIVELGDGSKPLKGWVELIKN